MIDKFKLRSYHFIIAICFIVWLAQTAYAPLTNLLALTPENFSFQPWRILTSMFSHALNPAHILLNMLSLWFIGRAVETRYPWWWFFTTYMVGGLIGGLAWVLWGPNEAVVGASGAIFAILGMALPLTRFHWSVLLLAGFNIGLGFIIPHVAWQVHLGGFFVGLIMGSIFAIKIVKHNRKAALSSTIVAS